ncbi:hypothetical protein [Microbacterium sp. 69-10]|uniref:hypothetical protein n=1 Tax=Microbacterium sp. 69-10 TaxID=1895783 RepID=UPI0025FA144B|nr:hypothetical protein [Microbacterium sp. 69-10]
MNDEYEQNVAALQHWLFMQTLEDLRERCAAVGHLVGGADRYSALGIAPLVRKLIVDKSSLIKTVNREHRLRITFPLRDITHDLSAGGTLDAVFTRHLLDREQHLTLDRFLSAPAFRIAGQWVSVVNTIRYYANVEGGVHLGEAETDAQRAMMATAAPSTSGADVMITVLAALGDVVLDGLHELVTTMKANPAEPTHASGTVILWDSMPAAPEPPR